MLSDVGVSHVRIIESLGLARISSVKASRDRFRLAKLMLIVLDEGRLSRLFNAAVGGGVVRHEPLGGGWVGCDGYVGFFLNVDSISYRAGEVVALTQGGVGTVCPCNIVGGVSSAMAGVSVGLV